MAAPDLSLLTRRRFAPLFVVQFLGAFNDNLFKFALLFLANFGLYAAEPAKAEMLATIATGLFILPYFLFSSIAGQLADAVDKARLAQAVKAAEVAIMLLAVFGFATQSVAVLLACLFGMGVHSTLFGPIKYAILPQHLRADEIMGGTGLIEAGTFLAILGGQLLGGLIPPWQAGFAGVGVAVAGLVASLFVPPAPAVTAASGAPLRIDWNIARGTMLLLRTARDGRDRRLAILGISWFFAVGAVLLSELAPLVSGTFGAGPSVATLCLLVFSVGVALGSLWVNRLLAGEVSARYVPAAALAMAVFLIDLWVAAHVFVPLNGGGWRSFAGQPQGWHVLLALAGIAVSGGVFIVPLYAILQTHSDRAVRSRVIAANNIVNAVVTVLMVVVVLILLGEGVGVPAVIGSLGIATLPIAMIARGLIGSGMTKAA